MLNLDRPVEQYAASNPAEAEAQAFKLKFFDRLNDRLNKDDDVEQTLETVFDTVISILKENWGSLTVEHVLTVVEAVLDYVLPYINLPGPDVVTRPIVKNVILKVVRPLAENLL